MRLVIVLSVAGAVAIMVGVGLVLLGTVLRHDTTRPPGQLIRLGLEVGAAGIVFGLIVLVVFAATRRRALDPSTVYSPSGLLDVPRDIRGPAPSGNYRLGGAGGPAAQSFSGSARSRTPDPYAPVAAYEVPAAPLTGGTPSGGWTSARRAGPGAGSGAGSATGGWSTVRSQDQPQARPGGTPPRGAYQPGMNQPGMNQPGMSQDSPGRAPQHAPGVPPIPPRDRTGPHESPRPGPAMPPRPAAPPRESSPLFDAMSRGSTPPRGATPLYDAMAPREPRPPREPMPPRGGAPQREPMPPRGPGMQRGPAPAREARRPGPSMPPRPGPVPPREPVNAAYPGPSGHPGSYDRGPAGGAARPPIPPGYADPRAPRAGATGAPGSAGFPGASGRAGFAGPSGGPPPGGPPPGGRPPAESAGQFDGGYARVIRASENPGRPASPARPADPARPQDSGRPREPAYPADVPDAVYIYRETSPQPDDAARAPAAESAEPDASYWYDLSGEDSGSKQDSNARKDAAEPTRGPFEPLISSGAPPGDAYPAAPTPTAAAVGEQHVDEHLDQLLAQ